jgi:hypothetical protein
MLMVMVASMQLLLCFRVINHDAKKQIVIYIGILVYFVAHHAINFKHKLL